VPFTGSNTNVQVAAFHRHPTLYKSQYQRAKKKDKRAAKKIDPAGWDDRHHLTLANNNVHVCDREYFDVPRTIDDGTQSRTLTDISVSDGCSKLDSASVRYDEALHGRRKRRSKKKKKKKKQQAMNQTGVAPGRVSSGYLADYVEEAEYARYPIYGHTEPQPQLDFPIPAFDTAAPATGAAVSATARF
jgi:hypothetical protein